tara:strand:+ start:247 stop:684 length:438 start_codon:yes stop_codon:yes gene_type:complete
MSDERNESAVDRATARADAAERTIEHLIREKAEVVDRADAAEKDRDEYKAKLRELRNSANDLRGVSNKPHYIRLCSEIVGRLGAHASLANRLCPPEQTPEKLLAEAKSEALRRLTEYELERTDMGGAVLNLITAFERVEAEDKKP